MIPVQKKYVGHKQPCLAAVCRGAHSPWPCQLRAAGQALSAALLWLLMMTVVYQ